MEPQQQPGQFGDVFERVKRILAEHLNVDPSTLRPDTDYYTVQNRARPVVHLRVVEAIIDCEQGFGVELQDKDLKLIPSTVGALADLIELKLRGQAVVWPPPPTGPRPPDLV